MYIYTFAVADRTTSEFIYRDGKSLTTLPLQHHQQSSSTLPPLGPSLKNGDTGRTGMQKLMPPPPPNANSDRIIPLNYVYTPGVNAAATTALGADLNASDKVRYDITFSNSVLRLQLLFLKGAAPPSYSWLSGRLCTWICINSCSLLLA